jgi:hypothetical protein
MPLRVVRQARCRDLIQKAFALGALDWVVKSRENRTGRPEVEL